MPVFLLSDYSKDLQKYWWNKECVWGSAGENTDELHFNYHCVLSVDARGDEGAHSKHRSLPSSQLDLSEPASCLRRNRTPIQEHSAFIRSSLKSCFIFAFDFFLMTATVPCYSLTVCVSASQVWLWNNTLREQKLLFCGHVAHLLQGQSARDNQAEGHLMQPWNKTPRLFHKLQFFCHLQNSE